MTPDALADRRRRRLAARLEQAPVVGWPQLCAVARAALSPDIDELEWAERIKARLAGLGFQYDPQAIARAMRAVEQVAGRPRPAAPIRRPSPPPAWSALSTTEAGSFLAAIRREAAWRTA